MNAVRIVVGCVLWACALGIAVDLVTAHVAVEYFTVHHPKVVESQEPLVMALVWGVGASWWFGLGAGLVLAWVHHRLPHHVPVRDVLRRVAHACAAIWVAMMVVLVATYLLILLVPPEQRRETFESDRRIMAVAIAHMTEYVFGAVAVLGVAVRLRRVGEPIKQAGL